MGTATQTTRDEIAGLTTAEVATRVDEGKVNRVKSHSSRSVADILRSNILTRFNAIISALLVVILVFGDVRDALFGVASNRPSPMAMASSSRSWPSQMRAAVMIRSARCMWLLVWGW